MDRPTDSLEPSLEISSSSSSQKQNNLGLECGSSITYPLSLSTDRHGSSGTSKAYVFHLMIQAYVMVKLAYPHFLIYNYIRLLQNQ